MESALKIIFVFSYRFYICNKHRYYNVEHSTVMLSSSQRPSSFSDGGFLARKRDDGTALCGKIFAKLSLGKKLDERNIYILNKLVHRMEIIKEIRVEEK